MINESIRYVDNNPVKIRVVNIRKKMQHYHEDIEIVFVLQGHVKLKNVHYTYNLGAGDVFVVNDCEMHSFEAEEDNMVMVMHLQMEYFTRYFEELHNSFFITNLAQEDEGMDLLRKDLLTMLSEFMVKDKHYEKRVVGYANNLITCLITDFRFFTMVEGMFVNKSDARGNEILADRLFRVTDYIYKNYKEKISLSDVANDIHISDYYLSHLIKTITGMSFQDYVNFARVEESEKLLLGTNNSITYISEECGFSAVRYYNKFFSRWFGVAPAEYRDRYIEAMEGMKGKQSSIAYQDRDVIKYLEDNYSDILFGINKVKQIDISAIDIDVDKIIPGMSKSIRSNINFYCNIRDFGYYFDEIMAASESLTFNSLVLQIKNKAFSSKDVSKMLNLGIKVVFQISEDSPEKDEITRRLMARFGDDLNIRYVQDGEVGDINFIYDSAMIVPHILMDTIEGKPSTNYRFVDSRKSSTVTSGEPGMYNSMGMIKPAYYAFKMLSDFTRGEVVETGKGYAVSKKGDTIFVIVYAEPEVWRQYSERVELLQTLKDQSKIEQRIIKLHGMAGKYRVHYYYYEDQHALFNVHANMSFEEFITREEEDFIRWVTIPNTGFFEIESHGILPINVEVSPNSAHLYALSKV